MTQIKSIAEPCWERGETERFWLWVTWPTGPGGAPAQKAIKPSGQLGLNCTRTFSDRPDGRTTNNPPPPLPRATATLLCQETAKPFSLKEMPLSRAAGCLVSLSTMEPGQRSPSVVQYLCRRAGTHALRLMCKVSSQQAAGTASTGLLTILSQVPI